MVKIMDMENKLWQSYFGAVWGKVCSIWHNIGGFVMDEKTESFMPMKTVVLLWDLERTQIMTSSEI